MASSATLCDVDMAWLGAGLVLLGNLGDEQLCIAYFDLA